MRRVGIFVAAVAGLVCTGAAQAATWNGHQVGRILPPDSRDCLFFELVGVSVAEPTIPSGYGWLAVPRTAYGFKEIYALLLMAKSTGIAVTVETTGAAAGGQCGAYAGVWQIYTTS